MKNILLALLMFVAVMFSFCQSKPAAKKSAGTSTSAVRPEDAFKAKMKSGKCCTSRTPPRFGVKSTAGR